MKKLLIFKILLFYGISSFSQTVNNIPISEIDVEYIQIKGISKSFSYKINVLIDFGQEMKYHTNGNIMDSKGKKVKFNSMIEALNFMSKNGYDFVQSYAFVSAGNHVYHYIMKKRKK